MKSKPETEKLQIITIGIGFTVVALLIFGIFALIKSLDFSSIIFSFGKNLRTDNAGHTNILLAGMGGEGHDGASLTDTIMLASIDYDHKLVSMLSIPRDLYAKSEKLKTGQRINQIYVEGKNKFNSKTGMEDLKDIVSGMTGMKVDYYALIDFSGFVKIVDSLGGVDLMVEKDLYDPFYPLGETIQYQTFSIKAGYQHLDGTTALKYARSRKTTSDFDRAKRQQQIIQAIKEKALSLNVLTNPGKIQALYESVKSSIETNFSVDEMIQLAKIGTEFGKDSLVSHVLSDDPNSCGGFLYTPAREFFDGASVLLPAGKNYDSVHEMSELIFGHPDVMLEQTPIQILNGTKKANLAAEVGDYLYRNCFNVLHYGNADKKDVTSTTIYYAPGTKGAGSRSDGLGPATTGEKPAVLELIAKYLPYQQVAGIPAVYLNSEKTAGTKVVIELGTDYLQNRLKNPFNIMPLLMAPPTQQATQQTDAKRP